jgi:hypothetical protein
VKQKLDSGCESYLVVPLFDGNIAFERRFDKTSFDEIKKDTLDRLKIS